MPADTPPNLQPTLEGEQIILRPLAPEDFEALHAIASDPLIWEQHPARDRWQREVFQRFFDDALKEPTNNGGALIVIDKSTGCVIGSSRYHGYHATKSEVEIGWTFLARSHWGGRYNSEMKRLMLDHAFTFVDRVIFLVGENNIRSQMAMERIGGVREGFVEKTDFGGPVSRSIKFVIHKCRQ